MKKTILKKIYKSIITIGWIIFLYILSALIYGILNFGGKISIYIKEINQKNISEIGKNYNRNLYKFFKIDNTKTNKKNIKYINNAGNNKKINDTGNIEKNYNNNNTGNIINETKIIDNQIDIMFKSN